MPGGGMRLQPVDNLLLNLQSPKARATIQTANTGLQGAAAAMAVQPTALINIGTVIRSGAGTYDVSVEGPDGPDIPCSLMVDLASYYLGVTDAYIPAEGTKVLYYLSNPGNGAGYIIGILPQADLSAPSYKVGTAPEYITQLWDYEPGVTAASAKPFSEPLEDSKNTHVINANMGRPQDIFPGNRVWMNEQGVGIAILNLLASMKASERAKIEVSCIDDMVKIVSGYFRHHTAQSDQEIYNDGGFLTKSEMGSSYQFERYGLDSYQKAWEDAGPGEYLTDPKNSRWPMIYPDAMPKGRIHELTGHLGDMVNLFVYRPDPNFHQENYKQDSIHQGLFHQHIDSSGRLTIRSAAGISFQRWDRIPVPKRKYEPWDPEGDKLEDEGEAILNPKEPFKFPSEYPYARNLVLRDANIWYNRMAYERIHAVSQSGERTDWFLPEEKDMPVPLNQYDDYGKATGATEDYDGNNASINIEEDGSIILRDNWGSELVMRGGNIILTCPGQLELRPGKSLVQLAGHDIIAKGRKSVDITASDNDVRIRAKKNLHAVAGDSSTENDDGGILLESLAKGTAFQDGPGERVVSRGIILKAKESTIHAEAQIVHTSASNRTIIEGFQEEDDSVKGDLIISIKRGLVTADSAFFLNVQDKSGVVLTKGAAALCGPGAFLLGGSTAAVMEDSKYHVPLMKVDIGQNPYADAFQPGAQALYEQFQLETEWLTPFRPDQRPDIEFTYRSSDEYGTIGATEVGIEATDFYVYEGSWAYLLRSGYQKIQGLTEKWDEEAIEETYPWPGEVYYHGSTPAYVKLASEVNVDDPGTGMPVSRANVTNTPGGLSAVPFSEYEVTLHQQERRR